MTSIGWVELLIILAGVFLLVFILVAVGLVVFLAQRQRSASAGRQPCPYCAELIKPGAKICRYCGRDLPAAGSRSGSAGGEDALLERDTEAPSGRQSQPPDVDSDLVECPACAGEGQVFPGVEENLWDGRLRWPDALQAETCELCGGTGEVQPETAANWEMAE